MDEHKGAIAQILAATTTTAVYAAYSFYQARKGSELTPEEMTDIKNGVFKEVAQLGGELAEHV